MIRALPVALVFAILACKNPSVQPPASLAPEELTLNIAPTSTNDRPNIIFIMADDLGYQDLGCYGQQLIQTPHIDNMAANGTLFTNFYAGATVCAPSRSTLMTGQHTGNTTVRANRKQQKKITKFIRRYFGGDGGRVALRPEDITVAQVLKQAGYVTGMTGKWGLGGERSKAVPNAKGFDDWLGYLNQKKAHNHFPTELWKNTEKIQIKENANKAEAVYSHDLFEQFALDFIENHRDTSFFLYLAFTLPHNEFEIPDKGIYKYRNWTEDEKVFAAMVTKLDRSVGLIQDQLKRLEIDKETIIFFCSDNGPAYQWKGRFNSAGSLKSGKHELYEGGIKVPMIVQWPEKIPAGFISDVPWYLPDVLPTLAALADVKPPYDIDGINMLSVLTDTTQKAPDRYMYWEDYMPNFVQAARWRNWKAIRFGDEDRIELYDLSSDHGEQIDLARQHPEIVSKFEEIYQGSHTDSPYWTADN